MSAVTANFDDLLGAIMLRIDAMILQQDWDGLAAAVGQRDQLLAEFVSAVKRAGGLHAAQQALLTRVLLHNENVMASCVRERDAIGAKLQEAQQSARGARAYLATDAL